MALSITNALVVDDSRLARVALSKQLKKRNIEVALAGDGTEAIEYLKSARPDVVFMDYMMPDMDGFAASEQILATPDLADLPIVMYSSQDGPEDRARAEALGIRGFLSKPSSGDALDKILQELQDSAPAAAKPQAAAEKSAAAAKPAGKPAEAGPSWDEMKLKLRALAQDAATEAVNRLGGENADALREELDHGLRNLHDQLHGELLEQLREAANAGVQRLAAEAAREESRKAAEEVVTRSVASQVKEAVRQPIDQLRHEVDAYFSNMASNAGFKQQVRDVAVSDALPAIQQALQPQVRELAAQAASEAAAEAAAESGKSVQQAIARLQKQLTALQAEQEAQQAAARRWRLAAIAGGLALAAALAASLLL